MVQAAGRAGKLARHATLTPVLPPAAQPPPTPKPSTQNPLPEARTGAGSLTRLCREVRAWRAIRASRAACKADSDAVVLAPQG